MLCRFSAYRTAMKIRELQKRLSRKFQQHSAFYPHFVKIEKGIVMEIFETVTLKDRCSSPSLVKCCN